MVPIHIIGHAGCGKTTLIVELVKAFCSKNIRIGTLKHSAHVHELDKPGKDSFLHREAGAAPVTMVTEKMSAVYLPRNEKTGPKELLETYYTTVEIVLIEGWISGPFQKIELWRKDLDLPPLYPQLNHVKALVSDDPTDQLSLPVFSRSDIDALVQFIQTLI